MSRVPGATLCVAIDTRGAAVAFNPRSKHSVKPTLIDTGHELTSISCPTTQRCVAVDGSGRALAGTTKPSSWSATTLTGASALFAVDCPSATECVAVDADRRRVHRPRLTHARLHPPLCQDRA